MYFRIGTSKRLGASNELVLHTDERFAIDKHAIFSYHLIHTINI